MGKRKEKIRKITYFIVSIMLITLISGCSENKNKDKESKNTEFTYFNKLPEKLKDDEYIFCIDKWNINLITKHSPFFAIDFDIISNKSLKDDEIKIKEGSSLITKLIKGEEIKVSEKFPEYLLLKYNNFDYEKLDRSIYGDKEVDAMLLKLDTEYNNLNKNDFPEFYDTKFQIYFNSNISNNKEIIKEISFLVGGKEYNIDCGNINLEKYQDDNKKYGTALDFQSYMKCKYPIEQNKDGLIYIEDQIKVDDDIVIKDIYLSNQPETTKIKKVFYDVENGKEVLNMEWSKGEKLELKKGSKVTMYVELEDKSIADISDYRLYYDLNVDYTYKKNTYTTSTYMVAQSRNSSEELYAMYKDKLDLKEYNYYCKSVDVPDGEE